MVIRAHKKLILTKHDSYLSHYWTIKTMNFCNYFGNTVEKTLNNEKTHDMIKENIKEYLGELRETKTTADYHL